MHQCIKFILFWNYILHVSDGLSVHHQEFKTVRTATCICQTDTADCLLAESSNCCHQEYAVAQLVEALRYKPEGRGFDSRRCH